MKNRIKAAFRWLVTPAVLFWESRPETKVFVICMAGIISAFVAFVASQVLGNLSVREFVDRCGARVVMDTTVFAGTGDCATCTVPANKRPTSIVYAQGQPVLNRIGLDVNVLLLWSRANVSGVFDTVVVRGDSTYMVHWWAFSAFARVDGKWIRVE
jgi:hypothetical protein